VEVECEDLSLIFVMRGVLRLVCWCLEGVGWICGHGGLKFFVFTQKVENLF
jgi:hypothetical protein